MALVYLDDNFTTHPKVIAAMDIDPLAPWLFVCGLTYCRKYLKGDGVIPESIVPTLSPRYKPRMRQALFAVNLWELFAPNYLVIHDYEFWNHSEDAQREARSEKARKANDVRWAEQRLRKLNAQAEANGHV